MHLHVTRRRAIIAAIIVLAALWTFAIRPSHDRDWSPDQAVLPFAQWSDDDRVIIRNVRDFRYRTTTEYDAAYEDRTYDLRDVESVWYAVEPFAANNPGMAHTLLSFGFTDGRYLAISVEIRKEKGESFSPWKGVLKRYEIMYVIADERDVLGLRATARGNDVFLYPTTASPKKARALLVSMLERTNALHAQPEFYHTLLNTCTTNILRHVNHIAEQPIPWDPSVLLPGHSDRLAYELGLIDTDLPFDQIRDRFRINERAAQDGDSPEFSARIRKEM